MASTTGKKSKGLRFEETTAAGTGPLDRHSSTKSLAGSGEDEPESRQKYRTETIQLLNHDATVLYISGVNRMPVEEILLALGIEMPNLLISVVGGSLRTYREEELLPLFAFGIVAAGVKVNSLIIDAGLAESSTSRVMGQALRLQGYMTNLLSVCPASGVTWSINSNHNSSFRSSSSSFFINKLQPLINNSSSSSSTALTEAAATSSLDPNHTHFVLVDGHYADWLYCNDVRVDIERQLSKMGIPSVTVLVDGSPDVIHDVYERVVKCGSTLITIGGVGKCSDYIAKRWNEHQKRASSSSSSNKAGPTTNDNNNDSYAGRDSSDRSVSSSRRSNMLRKYATNNSANKRNNNKRAQVYSDRGDDASTGRGDAGGAGNAGDYDGEDSGNNNNSAITADDDEYIKDPVIRFKLNEIFSKGNIHVIDINQPFTSSSSTSPRSSPPKDHHHNNHHRQRSISTALNGSPQTANVERIHRIIEESIFQVHQNSPFQEKQIAEAWRQYDLVHAAARMQKRNHRIMQFVIMSLVIFVVFLIVCQQQYMLDGGTKQSSTYRGLHFLIIAAPISLAILHGVKDFFNASKKWSILRGAAEAIKSEIFQFLTRSGSYRLKSGEAAAAQVARSFDDINEFLAARNTQLSFTLGKNLQAITQSIVNSNVGEIDLNSNGWRPSLLLHKVKQALRRRVAPVDNNNNNNNRSNTNNNGDGGTSPNTATPTGLSSSSTCHHHHRRLYSSSSSSTTTTTSSTFSLKFDQDNNEQQQGQQEQQQQQHASTPSSHHQHHHITTCMTMDQYIKQRVTPQIAYYEQKTPVLGRTLLALHWCSYILCGVGTLVSAFDRDIWVAWILAFATAFVSSLEYERVQDRLIRYHQAKSELVNLQMWWESLPLLERVKRQHKLVDAVEETIRFESNWMISANKLHDGGIKASADDAVVVDIMPDHHHHHHHQRYHAVPRTLSESYLLHQRGSGVAAGARFGVAADDYDATFVEEEEEEAQGGEEKGQHLLGRYSEEEKEEENAAAFIQQHANDEGGSESSGANNQ